MERILWADDEIDLLKPHILFLKDKGYHVDITKSGVDVLEMLEKHNYDIVLLDENMPGISGLDTLKGIKDIRPELPVIMITKSEEEDLMTQAIGRQIADYLIKPVNPLQILLSIKKILHRETIVAAHAAADYRHEFNKLSADIGVASTLENWKDIYRRIVGWEMKLADIDSALGEMLSIQKKEANSAFARFTKSRYENWLNGDEDIVMSHNLITQRVLPHIKNGDKVFLMIIDNFRLDQWRSLVPFITEYFNYQEDLYLSILPTSTQFARNAIFAGMMPREIELLYPGLWAHDQEAESLNEHEETLLEGLLHRHKIDIKFSFTKINDTCAAEKYLNRINDLKTNVFNVIVLNFIDMLSHAGTESRMIRELTGSDQAYRSLSASWLQYSPIMEILRHMAILGFHILISTDHGTIRVEKPIKVIGDRATNSNLRYKVGKNLNYNAGQVFEITDPSRFGLPSPNISSRYIFATVDDFFVYPNNYNFYAHHYSNTYQHGGISIEEMLCPLITLIPK